MNRKMVFLNLVLVALAGVLVWQIRVRWVAAHAHERDVLGDNARVLKILAPPPPPPVRTAAPADYLEVAQRTLFSRDRNPNVVVEPPPPPPAPPPMPPLPVYYGQMSFGEPVVFLSIADKGQKGYHAGDEIGPFKVVSFDRDNITFDWKGEPVERMLEELKPKASTLSQAAVNLAPAAPPAGASVQSLGNVAAPAAAAANAPANPTLGTDMGAGFRACAAGDNSPAGTVLNGFRKVMARTVMGSSCHWEQIK